MAVKAYLVDDSDDATISIEPCDDGPTWKIAGSLGTTVYVSTDDLKRFLELVRFMVEQHEAEAS